MDEMSFFQAVQEGNLEKVRQALTAQPGFASARRADELSAVLLAAYYGQQEIVELLLAHGAPLDLFEAAAVGNLAGVESALEDHPDQLHGFSTDGFQALGLGAFFGHAAVVERLLQAGAAVDTPSRNGLAVPPLNSAAAGGQTEIARLLLAHGANPNSKQGEGFVPLHAAAENGQIEMITLLLSAGADPAVETADGRTSRELAIAKGHTEAAALLTSSAAGQGN